MGVEGGYPCNFGREYLYVANGILHEIDCLIAVTNSNLKCCQHSCYFHNTSHNSNSIITMFSLTNI